MAETRAFSVEVGGSIPSGSTNIFSNRNAGWCVANPEKG